MLIVAFVNRWLGAVFKGRNTLIVLVLQLPYM